MKTDQAKKYQCYRCEGEGEIALMAHEPRTEKDRNGDMIHWRELVPKWHPCGVCKDGMVDKETLKQQLFTDFHYNNLDIIHLFEESQVD